MTSRRQIGFWAVAFLVFCLIVWALSSVLLPFLVGMAIAYLLDPVADRMEALGVPRSLATFLILIGFVLIVLAAVVLLFPLIRDQIVALAHALPGFISRVREVGESWINDMMARFNRRDRPNLGNGFPDIGQNVMSVLGDLLSGLWTGGGVVFNFVSILLITPLVAFYLLRDWDRLIAKIDSWLPRPYAPVIRAQAAEIDKVLAGFVRGQILVCMISSALYMIGWTAVGLDFALVIGLAAGFLAFIPYIGGFVGLGVSLAVGIGQFGVDWTQLGLIFGVYLIVQGLEGSVVQPRLVGHNVGLHDLWVIFALMAGGALFGFVGVLIAVPAAAAIGVLVRFSLTRYLASPYYTGHDVAILPERPPPV